MLKTRVLLLTLMVTSGLAFGLGNATFVYAEGAAYLKNDPKACSNCHVMREQYEGWQRGSHRAVATCNDCHAPHALLPKLWVKARNGFFHSWYFTTGGFHEPIQIGETNRRVTQGACRDCHEQITSAIDFAGEGSAHGSSVRGSEEVDCIRCHRDVGHLH